VSKPKIYALFFLGLLLPFFFPQVRDQMVNNYTASGVQARVEALRDKSVPATMAMIAYYKAQAEQQGYIFINGKGVQVAPKGQSGPVPAAGDFSLTAGNSLDASEIQAILQSYNSPAVGYEYAFIQGSEKYGIDSAYVLAMFIHESTAGTRGVAVTTHSVGNIKATDGNSFEGFQRYNDWAEGTLAHFELLAHYRDKLGDKTLADAITRWAPPRNSDGSFENDTSGYIAEAEAMVAGWRKAKQGQSVAVGSPNAQQQLWPAAPAVNLPPGEKVVSEELPMDGFGVYNADTMKNTIENSIVNSPGLQSVTIPPGGDWSFMEAWTVDVNTLATEYGVLGAGMCDVAARYSSAAHKLGLGSVSFVDHQNNGIDLAIVGPEDNTAVFGTPGVRGGEDLVIANTTAKTVKMAGVIENGHFVVYGWYE
jgi:hypothetical protein